jgi:hypothetical protein
MIDIIYHMYSELSCRSRLFYYIYISRQAQLINKYSFNILYYFYMVSREVTILT